MRVIILGIAVVLPLVVSAFSQEMPRSGGSLECSKQADSQGLHGAERAAFRSRCKASSGGSAQQATQQVTLSTTSITTQECAIRYQAAKAAGTLAGRQWMEFRSTECSSASQPGLKLVFPNGISPIYSQEPEGQARMHTCVDQYNANKAANASGGMKWIEAGGGYYSACNEHLKTATSNPRQQTKPLTPAPTIAATHVDIFSYCKTVINLDNHGNTTIDSQSEIVLAKALNTDVFAWRCMDSDVFACKTGASGSACQKMSASKLPTAAISAFCAQQPNTEFVPMSVIGNSPASWKCFGSVPQILQSVQLDKRNFMKGSWKIVDREAPPSQGPSQVAAPQAAVPLTQEEIDAFRKAILSWSPPQGAPALDVRIRLKRDGAIDGSPEILSTGTGATFEAAKDSAIRTVIQAQPFKMFRLESYEAWKDMIVTFEAPVVQAAQQSQDSQSACTSKYEATKANGTIGAISREDFLRICSISAEPAMPTSVPVVQESENNSIPSPVASAVYTDPAAYCEAVKTMDLADAQYKGPKVTENMTKALGVSFALYAGHPEYDGSPSSGVIFWRCANASVLACFEGSNGAGACSKFKSTAAAPTEISAFCQSNPNADNVPGTHARWACRGNRAVMKNLDGRGFLSFQWKMVKS